MLIAVLGLCFGFGLIVLALNYSIALGSFMIGAIIAEAKPLHLIEKLVEPLRDMFCAIFFVTIGMMFNPTIIIHNLGTILIISSVLILGKITGNTIGAFCSGEKVSISLKIGMGLAQIGEFSFIIASLGSNLKVTSDSLYPIAIAVSAITTLTTPYLIKLADPLAFFIHQRTPKKIVYQAQKYTIWLSELHPKGDSAFITKTIAKIFLQIIVNCALIMAVFLAGTYLANRVNSEIINLGLVEHEQLHKSIICGIALLISLPFAIASYRKFKALAMILAEIIIRHKQFGNITYSVRQVIFELLPIIAIFLIMSFIFSLTSPILPQTQYLFTLIMFTILIGYWFRKQFIFMQSWLQIRLFAVFSDNDK
jgi:CPA2 family monovalent cation:H+ antiporter-2